MRKSQEYQLTEKGLKNVLRALSTLQNQYRGPNVPPIFADSTLHYKLSLESAQDPEDKRATHLHLIEAEKRGYIQRGTFFSRIGKNITMHVGFRIRDPILSEVEVLIKD